MPAPPRTIHGFAAAWAGLGAILSSGCYLTPNFGSPGTIGMQRARAVLHDPFPNNDIAPPIVSGRPLGFDRPLSEPAQAQISAGNRGARVTPWQGF